MRKILIFLMFCGGLLSAQEVISGAESDIKITPIIHASMVIEWDGNTILVDPAEGAGLYTAFQPVDYIIITHTHGDHMDKETLRGLEFEDATLIAPATVSEQLKEFEFAKEIILKSGEKKNLGLFAITSVPMYNLPEGTGGHKKGEGNGYVLTIDGKRIYISGDTEDIDEMRNLKGIDVAFVCMNLPYTMTEKQAADAVVAFKPKVVYPYHFRGKEGFSDVNLFKNLVNASATDIEVKLLDWYPEKPEEE